MPATTAPPPATTSGHRKTFPVDFSGEHQICSSSSDLPNPLPHSPSLAFFPPPPLRLLSHRSQHRHHHATPAAVITIIVINSSTAAPQPPQPHHGGVGLAVVTPLLP
ncbi:hypothetical protein Tco_0832036 [Tanacetum coccineum]